jgi:hypothetical protein
MLALLIPYLLLPLAAAAMLWGKDRPWSAGGCYLACAVGPPLAAYVLFELAMRSPGSGPHGMAELFIAIYFGGATWLGFMIIAFVYALVAPRGVEGGDLSHTVSLLVPNQDGAAD